ncbi:MAG: hypothetical protein ACOCUP_03120, partial [bacterium]
MKRIITNPIKSQGQLFTLIAFLLIALTSLNVSGQAPQLIPVDAVANQYPITFTNEAQNEFVLHFDQELTGGTEKSCWEVKIGVNIYNPFSVTVSGNTVFLELFDEITFDPISVPYDLRESVTVTYNAGGICNLRNLSGDNVASFTDIQAVNNWIINSDDFTIGLYGRTGNIDICAAIEDVEIEYNFSLSRKSRNSIHYFPPRMYLRWQ